jgi:phospholipase C
VCDRRQAVAAACAAAAFSFGPAGCGERASGIAPAVAPAHSSAFGARTHPGSPIRHVVFIIQENRSFDDLFQGYPGADTQAWGYDSKGRKIKLHPIGLQAHYDIDHSSAAFFAAYDGGKMDGFDLESVNGTYGRDPTYGFVPPDESKPYFEIARQYVLADRMFTSNIDESFVSHQYAIAGQSQSAVDLPSQGWGCDSRGRDWVLTLTEKRGYGKKESPCFDYQTLADELDAAGLGWRYYAEAPTYVWSAFQAVAHIRNGGDWSNVEDDSAIFSDISSGTLGAVTWVTPTCANSDHSGCEGKTGPDWVASIVNAVGQSPFWKSSAIFVIWDEWGGWYDHVPPPYVDYDGLGFRVPLLVVSPYAKRGYVSHVQYEHGSILRFIEDQFGLEPLAASDLRANSPQADCFDFSRPPRPFRPIATTLKARDFERAEPDLRPPDDDWPGAASSLAGLPQKS